MNCNNNECNDVKKLINFFEEMGEHHVDHGVVWLKTQEERYSKYNHQYNVYHLKTYYEELGTTCINAKSEKDKSRKNSISYKNQDIFRTRVDVALNNIDLKVFKNIKESANQRKDLIDKTKEKDEKENNVQQVKKNTSTSSVGTQHVPTIESDNNVQKICNKKLDSSTTKVDVVLSINDLKVLQNIKESANHRNDLIDKIKVKDEKENNVQQVKKNTATSSNATQLATTIESHNNVKKICNKKLEYFIGNKVHPKTKNNSTKSTDFKELQCESNNTKINTMTKANIDRVCSLVEAKNISTESKDSIKLQCENIKGKVNVKPKTEIEKVCSLIEAKNSLIKNKNSKKFQRENIEVNVKPKTKLEKVCSPVMTKNDLIENNYSKNFQQENIEMNVKPKRKMERVYSLVETKNNSIENNDSKKLERDSKMNSKQKMERVCSVMVTKTELKDKLQTIDLNSLLVFHENMKRMHKNKNIKSNTNIEKVCSPVDKVAGLKDVKEKRNSDNRPILDTNIPKDILEETNALASCSHSVQLDKENSKNENKEKVVTEAKQNDTIIIQDTYLQQPQLYLFQENVENITMDKEKNVIFNTNIMDINLTERKKLKEDQEHIDQTPSPKEPTTKDFIEKNTITQTCDKHSAILEDKDSINEIGKNINIETKKGNNIETTSCEDNIDDEEISNGNTIMDNIVLSELHKDTFVEIFNPNFNIYNRSIETPKSTEKAIEFGNDYEINQENFVYDYVHATETINVNVNTDVVSENEFVDIPELKDDYKFIDTKITGTVRKKFIRKNRRKRKHSKSKPGKYQQEGEAIAKFQNTCIDEEDNEDIKNIDIQESTNNTKKLEKICNKPLKSPKPNEEENENEKCFELNDLNTNKNFVDFQNLILTNTNQVPHYENVFVDEVGKVRVKDDAVSNNNVLQKQKYKTKSVKTKRSKYQKRDNARYRKAKDEPTITIVEDSNKVVNHTYENVVLALQKGLAEVVNISLATVGADSETIGDQNIDFTAAYPCNTLEKSNKNIYRSTIIYNSHQEPIFKTIEKIGNIETHTYVANETELTSEKIQKEEEEVEETPKPKLNQIHCTINELIQTEDRYMECMRILIDDYMPYLAEQQMPHLIGKYCYIFGNIEQIYEENKKFYSEISKCEYSLEKLAKCFKNGETCLFALYPPYFRNKQESESLVQGEFKSIINERKVELNDKLHISSYLMKPIQRLGQYILFLDKILHELKKQNKHSKEIEEARDIVKRYMSLGNHYVAIDSIHNIPFELNLISGSFLLRQTFNIIKPKKYTASMFLFEEILIITIVDPKDVQRYLFKDSISLKNLSIVINTDNPLMFEIRNFKSNKSIDSYLVEASYELDKSEWVTKIEDLLWNQLKTYKEQQKKENTEEHFIDVARL